MCRLYFDQTAQHHNQKDHSCYRIMRTLVPNSPCPQDAFWWRENPPPTNRGTEGLCPACTDAFPGDPPTPSLSLDACSRFLSSKYFFFSSFISLVSLSISYLYSATYAVYILSSDATAYSCFCFSFTVDWYSASCSVTSGPGYLARIFLSSMYSFSFSWMRRSFSTTSSVLPMRRFCSTWTFWISSYMAGSLPSSLRQRWTLRGFSSSSLRALTLVRS